MSEIIQRFVHMRIEPNEHMIEAWLYSDDSKDAERIAMVGSLAGRLVDDDEPALCQWAETMQNLVVKSLGALPGCVGAAKGKTLEEALRNASLNTATRDAAEADPLAEFDKIFNND